MSPARHHHALPEGYHLHWYEIDSILGQGGFGITYLARDTNLDQLVAIKEFLPSDLAARTEDSMVQPLSGSHTDTYGWGLNRFLTEARTLAKFRHRNIVRVMSVFEANNTAYMVMEYERGESFENMLKFKQVRGEEALKRVLLALLDGLELVHDAGFIHRDIKPSNVYLREDGVPVLLDFGSARLALGVETRTLTSLVSPGYAPFEQYNATRESDKQGPWTDIYALGATMYRAVTGQGPIDAAARANLLLDEQRDPYEPCAESAAGAFSPEFLNAIDRALAFAPADRPQSVAAWRRLVLAGAVDTNTETIAAGMGAASIAGVDIVLDGDDGVPAPATATGAATRTVPMAELEAAGTTRPATATTQAAPAPAASGRGWFVATSLVAVIGVAVVAWLTLTPAGREVATAPTAPEPPAATPEMKASDESPAQPSPQPTAAAPEQPPVIESKAPSASEPAPPAPKPSITEAIAAAAAHRASQPAPAPVQEKPAEKKTVEKKKAPPPPAPAPKKTAPEQVAKAAPPPKPAKKSTKTAPPPKKKSSKKSSAPSTRKEKVAAHLASGDAHLRAGRLSKPRRRNALRDYMTVLAMDTDNAAARRGVERIVERYVAMGGKAIGAGNFDKANDYLGQARFVLDQMKLRKWPRDTYSALFEKYRLAAQHLANTR